MIIMSLPHTYVEFLSLLPLQKTDYSGTLVHELHSLIILQKKTMHTFSFGKDDSGQFRYPVQSLQTEMTS